MEHLDALRKIGEFYPTSIEKQLKKKVNCRTEPDERSQKFINCKSMELIMTGQLSLEIVCITCFRTTDLNEHPLFLASLCSVCLDKFKTNLFAYGKNGKCIFCALCGGGKNIAICGEVGRPRAFCGACVKHIICSGFHEDILLQHPWQCFGCNPNQLVNGVLKIRDDWRSAVISMYQVDASNKTLSDFSHVGRGRMIRVLSLFDGIGAGLVVLEKLVIAIECYSASEIDRDSMLVNSFNHKKAIIQLGDVRDIDENKIRGIAPIDLLTGGSPCNDLSSVNPRRRGLNDPNGTGILFYEYCRIMKLLKKYNKSRHLFWLFENVASMSRESRQQIRESLGCEPRVIDSVDYSAQRRPRLYWGNIPWGSHERINITLQDAVHTSCGREALVQKVTTITTRSNPLIQTKENLKPVLMDGKKDELWSTELENIFGFTTHYTDVNLGKIRRLQLLGRAWDVRTLTGILRPVEYFY
ncbi:hypothetical protein QAD02_021512 [Eretmocerus hayati]|uniref:Uncharacterized protein n=1 Tax=Eretmocerus hayati TaxID=131215 RepID=A0ACC2PQ42_9HYME|nr:hypothetical protein QAD02_021512 [Eretmocerus hayati]